MQQVFEMQDALNNTVLNNLGIDYNLIKMFPERHGHWIENYRKALSAEYAELLRDLLSTGDNVSDNAKVEVVDMLHFLVSLSQLVRISPEEAMELSSGLTGQMADSDPTLISETFLLALDDLQNSLKWKWWAKGGGYKPEKARAAVVQLWKTWWEVADAMVEMGFDEIKTLYMEKNEVNFQRQANGYNEDTKTEDDNLSLHSE